MDFKKCHEYYKVGKLADGLEAIAVIGRVMALYEKTYHATIYVKSPKHSFGCEELRRKMHHTPNAERLTDIWDLVPGEGKSFQQKTLFGLVDELGWKKN